MAYRHFKEEWTDLRLLSENKIQKIYAPYRFNLEKDFVIHTTYLELFQQHLKDYMIQDGRNLDIEPIVLAPSQEEQEYDTCILFWKHDRRRSSKHRK